MKNSIMASIVRFSQPRWFLAGALLVLLAVFSIRMVNLDCDLPPWGVSLYTSLDEGTYAAMAINKYNYGIVNCEDLPVPSVTDNAHRNNLIGNAATYCSLRLFGDNYFGLRFPSVVWSFGTLLLMALVLLRRLPASPFRNLVVIAALAAPVLNYQYLVASRVVEPSVVRMFFVTLLAAILVVPRQSCLTLFAAGFVSVLLVTLVYVSTVFVGLPLAALLFILLATGKRWRAVALVLGAASAFVVGEVYYRMVWHVSFVENAVGAVVGFSNISGYAHSSQLVNVWDNVKAILMNRCFLYGAPLLALLIVAMPGVVYRLRRRQLSVDAVMFSFIGAFILQTLVFEDYVSRKFIVVYPLVILGVVFSLPEAVAFWRRLGRWWIYLALGESDGADSTQGRRYPIGRYAVSAALVAALLLAIVAVHLPIFEVKPFKRDFKLAGFDRTALSVAMILPLAVAAWLCLRPSRRRIACAATLVVVGWLASNAFFSIKYVYCNQHHVERDFMKLLGERMGSGRLWGEWAYSYTLYNDIKPVEGCYDSLFEGIKADGGGYLFNYEPQYADERLVNAATRKGLALVPDIWLRHSFLTLGGYHDHIVYRVEPYCGENIRLTPFLESHIKGLGFELPCDRRKRPFLPRELSAYLDIRDRGMHVP